MVNSKYTMIEISSETPIRLETSRLILREFQPNDLVDFHTYASDLDVVRFTPWGPIKDLEESKKFLDAVMTEKNQKPRYSFELAIVENVSQKLIGHGFLRVTHPRNREGEVGYFLNKEFWDKGYTTEAVQTLLKFGFERLGLHRIFGTCHPDNIGSARVMEKVGMKYEGRLRDHKFIPREGRFRDSLLYAILEDEWRTTQDVSDP